MPPILPIEIIELVFGFLRDDVRALANCALTCSALLTGHNMSRSRLARRDAPRDRRKAIYPTPRLTRFLDLLNATPALAGRTAPRDVHLAALQPAFPRGPACAQKVAAAHIVGGEYALAPLVRLADALAEHGMHETLEELELDTHCLSWDVRARRRSRAGVGDAAPRGRPKGAGEAPGAPDRCVVRPPMCNREPILDMERSCARTSARVCSPTLRSPAVRSRSSTPRRSPMSRGATPFPDLEVLALGWTRSFERLDGCVRRWWGRWWGSDAGAGAGGGVVAGGDAWAGLRRWAAWRRRG
ncbi:hypothetical protein C8Q76DRAFT_804442 [Earliella scabrosa]|nr:hypothetical protein C8Q76DRAFT_804442 [Earliella scabrosa]